MDEKNSSAESESTNLVQVAKAGIARRGAPMSVGDLEHRLLALYPRADAEEWDRMGILVGDAGATVKGVAVALDVTQDAIAACVKLGANVLLTHHPAFLDPPETIAPQMTRAGTVGAAVWSAVSNGIALMNFHTALDANPDGNGALPRMLNLDAQGVICPIGDDSLKGYGRVCSVRAADAPLSLGQLAARCLSVFGRRPRVWGDSSDKLSRIVVATGSAGNVVQPCLEDGIDCLVCGELHYHTALDAAQMGLRIIELGHDVSELPLAAVLGAAAVECGIPADSVHAIDQSGNWDTPVATRI